MDIGQALDALETGFLAGADAQEGFLDKVREYPTQLDNAGFSLQEFIKLATTEVRAGIFDDKLLDTIKEANLSITELTQTQKDALLPLGAEFVAELEKGIRSGEITTRDALISIADQAKKSGADLQQIQVVTADIFKGAGEDAGGFEKVIGAVFDAIETDYNSLIDTENELVRQQQELLRLNNEFAQAQNELAKELGAVDGSLQSVGLQLKTALLEGFLGIIRTFKDLFAIVAPFRDALLRLAETLGIVGESGRVTEATARALGKAYEIAQIPLKVFVGVLTSTVDRFNEFASLVRGFLERIGVIDKVQADSAAAQKKAQEEILKSQAGIEQQNRKAEDSYKALKAEADKTTGSLTKQAEAAEKLAEGSLAFLRKEIQVLRVELSKAPDAATFASLSYELEQAELKLEQTTAAYQRFRDAQRGVTSVVRAIPSSISGFGADATNEQLVGGIIAQLGLEAEAEKELAEETAAIVNEIKLQAQEDYLQRRQEKFDEQLEQEQQLAEAQKEIISGAYGDIGDALNNFLSGQTSTLKGFLKEVIIAVLSAVEKTILLTTVEAQARVIAANAGIPGIGLAKGLAESGLVAGLIKGLFAGIKAAVQSFDAGGLVLPIELLARPGSIPALQPGRISHRQNIPARPGGDNILITAKSGEMVLNRRQQAKAQALFGSDIWKILGVPGFQAGGLVTPQLVNPNTFLSTTAPAASPISLDPESVNAQANVIAGQVAQEVSSAVERGIEAANQRTERRRKLEQNIQI